MNKYEKLIEYVIGDDTAKAEELFHDIVVEKSRDIYESLMDEDQDFGGDAADEMVNDISADEEGMTEDDDDMMDPGMDDDMGAEPEMGTDSDMDDEMGMDDMGHEAGEGEESLEDRVVDVEDQLDALMAEFDSMMGGDEMGDMASGELDSMDDETMGMEPANDEFGGEEDMAMGMEGRFNEAVSLTKVTNGIAGTTEGESVGSGNETTAVNTKTINNDNSGSKGSAAKPHQKVGEENGASTPTVKPGNSTTEPNESKVKEPKKKGEDGGTNKTSVAKQNRS